MKYRFAGLVALLAAGAAQPAAQDHVVRVPLAYRAPGEGPTPNFSPRGTQVQLTATPADAPLPTGSVQPAKTGVIMLGADRSSWIPVLATASVEHPRDLCRLYLDRNRNGKFDDDGAALTAPPSQNEKTKAWWTSLRQVELSIPYGGSPEPYLVNFWIVRDGEAVPDILRYSVGSWRAGTVTIDGVPALVAAMDGDNNASFDKADSWSVLEASAPDAARAVLSYTEARGTSRLMYVKDSARELVLEFRAFSPDGRWIEFARVNRPSTKAEDRGADDMVAPERARPRTTTPVKWEHDFETALLRAKTANKKILIDFETTWCGPCKTMDQWIWTDAEVAGLINAGFVGVKLDGDVEKALVERFKVRGYPTMMVLDPAGRETHRFVGYLPSKEAIAFLNR